MGKRQRRYGTGRDHMLRKGARDKRGLNRHMGTLSIFVHEDESMTKTLFPRHPNTGGGQSIREQSSPDHNCRHAEEENCSQDLGHINRSLACTLYSLYMCICTYV